MNDQPHLQRKADEAYRRNEMHKVEPSYKGGNLKTRTLVLLAVSLAVFWVIAIVWSVT